MNNCKACEAYRDCKVSLYCDKHQEEKYLKNYKKIADWLVSKKTDDLFSFHNRLAIYMSLEWGIKSLKSLKF